jgi:hypothetical protein
LVPGVGQAVDHAQIEGAGAGLFFLDDHLRGEKIRTQAFNESGGRAAVVTSPCMRVGPPAAPRGRWIRRPRRGAVRLRASLLKLPGMSPAIAIAVRPLPSAALCCT